MPWTWSKKHEKDLTSLVTSDAIDWLGVPLDWYALSYQAGRRAVVKAIYEALLTKNIRYVPEQYQPEETTQLVRTPPEILQTQLQGTCLDLAALFCGLCFGFELLPVMIMLDGHALVAVSLNHGLREWDKFDREEKYLYENDLMHDVEVLRGLIRRDEYIAVECTGFAQLTGMRGGEPELEGRNEKGILPFSEAVTAGAKQLTHEDREFKYSIDIAVARWNWKIDPRPILGGPALSGRALYEKYRRYLVNAIQKVFPRPRVEFNMNFSIGQEKSLPIDSLVEKTESEFRLILAGDAGGGKTMALRRCTDALLDRDIAPVVLNLKKWRREYSKELKRLVDDRADVEDKFDLLLKVCSITDLTPKMINEFPEGKRRFIIVDGLNEVYGKDETRQVLNLLSDYVREKWPGACALVTDRVTGRAAQDSNWQTVALNHLDLREVEDKITEKFGVDVYNSLPRTDLDLLRVPYFLDLALKSASPRLGSAARAIESYFVERVGLDQAALDELAEAAFKAYREYRSTSFNAEKFREQVSAETWEKLLSSGVLKVSEEDAQFDHQLKQDYLASRYLAHNESTWDSASFDVVSFESKSYESILIALEQLPDTDQGDRFLKSVYDWNWGIAVACLANAWRAGRELCSLEIRYAMLAVVAEKLFDPVSPTRESAKKRLSTFSDEVATQFLQSEGLQAIFDRVRGLESQVGWFLDWRSLFTRSNVEPLTEGEIRKVLSKDPFLGWTASNIIKRFELREPDLRQLRAYFDYYQTVRGEPTPHDDTIQWRIVHALGVSAIKSNADLLLITLDEGRYHWAKYGAARSLVEIAAKTADESLRQYVINQLIDRVGGLQQNVLDEIGKAVFFTGAPESWGRQVTPLLELVRDAQATESERSQFDGILTDFKTTYKVEE